MYGRKRNRTVASTKKRKGYIYVSRRLSEPNLYKIGFTTISPASRIYKSYKMYDRHESWYPVFCIYCSVPYSTEKRVHKDLREHRVKNTELFYVDINIIKNSIRSNAATIFMEIEPKSIENEINDIHKSLYGYPALISRQQKVKFKREAELKRTEQLKISEAQRVKRIEERERESEQLKEKVWIVIILSIVFYYFFLK